MTLAKSIFVTYNVSYFICKYLINIVKKCKFNAKFGFSKVIKYEKLSFGFKEKKYAKQLEEITYKLHNGKTMLILGRQEVWTLIFRESENAISLFSESYLIVMN